MRWGVNMLPASRPRRRTLGRALRNCGTDRSWRRPARARHCRRVRPVAPPAPPRRPCPRPGASGTGLAPLGDRRGIAPSSTRARTLGASAAASGPKSWPLPSPPAINTSGPGSPWTAARVAPTLVPLESSYQRTPRRSSTSWVRWGRPVKSRSAASIGSRLEPQGLAQG